MAIEIGKPAPEFELEASNGERVKLSDYRGKNVVLYFYPKDMTPAARLRHVISGTSIRILKM